MRANPILVVAFIGLALLIALVLGASYWAFQQITESGEARAHVSLVRTRADDLLTTMIDAQSAALGYSLTGDGAFLQSYETLSKRLPVQLQELTQRVAAAPVKAQLALLRPRVEAALAEISRLVVMRNEAPQIAAIAEGSAKQLMDSMRLDMHHFVTAQETLLASYEARYQANMHTLFLVILASGTLSAVLALFLVLSIYRVSKSRLAELVHIETQHLLDVQREINRQLAEAYDSLRRSEDLLSVTFDSIGDGVLATDIEGRVTRMNAIAEHLTGWKLAQACGRPVEEVFEIINQQTRLPSKVPITDTLKHGTAQGLANHTILIARNGDEHAIADSCAPIRDPVQVIGAVLVFRDVSKEYAVQAAVRDREALLQAILNTVEDGVIMFRAKGAIVQTVNPAATTLFGYSAHEMLGKKFSLLVPELDNDETEGSLLYYSASAATLTAGLIREVTGRRKDGSQFSLEIAVTEMALGGERYFTSVLRDVSTRRQIEQQRDAAVAESVKASNAKTDFLSSMSHELRTPLNAILGFAQLIESGTPLPTANQKRSVDQILKAGWYLLELISEVLDLARIEAGNVGLSHEPVRLPEILLECKAMVEPQAQQRGIRLRFPHFAAPYCVSADRTRLKQVFINLLFNAVKYNRPHGTVSVDCALVEQSAIRINIRDTGMGLTHEQMGHLFQPFNRLGKESGVEEGTGIGLVVSKRLVELMDGTIGADSTVGVGSVFWIELKLTSAPRLCAIPAADAQAVELPLSAPKRTLLYVEDNPANLELVEQIIERRADLRLLAAADGYLGIEFARAYQPDVILMDINLPGMSGEEAMHALHLDPSTAHIPIIAISANAMPRDIERGISAGFFDYLTKPIKVSKFLETLDAALIYSNVSELPTATRTV